MCEFQAQLRRHDSTAAVGWVTGDPDFHVRRMAPLVL
jgi:hypothetical protein